MTIAGRVGTAAVFPNDLAEGNITGHIVGIDLPETINPHYVAAFINSELGQFQVDRWAQRTTRPELNLFEVGQILITLPPRPVQDRIAQVMQDAYAARQVKLVEAEALLKDIESLVLEMLEIPADLPKDEKHFTVKRSLLHRSDVRYFSPYYQQIEQHIQSGKFATQPLRTLCTKLTNGLTPARAAYEDEGHIVVKVASLTKDWRIDWNKIAFTSEAFFDKAKRASIEQDDLLILSASHQLDYIGRNFGLVLDIPKSIQGRCIAVGELIIARLNKQKVLPKYILACFVTRPFQELINRMTRGQSAHLYSEDLGSLQIPIPPNSVQKRIANEIDSRCAAARHLRAEAEGIVAEAKAHVERMILGEEPAL